VDSLIAADAAVNLGLGLLEMLMYYAAYIVVYLFG
jgi:hypothetical protein